MDTEPIANPFVTPRPIGVAPTGELRHIVGQVYYGAVILLSGGSTDAVVFPTAHVPTPELMEVERVVGVYYLPRPVRGGATPNIIGDTHPG